MPRSLSRSPTPGSPGRTPTAPPNAGVVDFHRLNENECEITLSMDVEPHGLTEIVGAKLGFLDRQG